MEAFLGWIEASTPVAALKSSFYVYPLVNAVHIAAVGTVFATVALMDLAILKVWRGLSGERAVAALRPVALTAFAVTAASGLALFSVRASEYAGNPAFLAKLVLIACAGANFLLFARTRPGPKAAAASLAFWTAALFAGRFIGFL